PTMNAAEREVITAKIERINSEVDRKMGKIGKVTKYLGQSQISPRVSAALQSNTTPTSQLKALLDASTNPPLAMRIAIARNTNAGPELLTRLATDTDATVRHAVASNPNTSTLQLSAMVAD